MSSPRPPGKSNSFDEIGFWVKECRVSYNNIVVEWEPDLSGPIKGSLVTKLPFCITCPASRKNTTKPEVNLSVHPLVESCVQIRTKGSWFEGVCQNGFREAKAIFPDTGQRKPPIVAQ